MFNLRNIVNFTNSSLGWVKIKVPDKMNEQNHQISIRRRETIFNNGCTVVMKG